MSSAVHNLANLYVLTNKENGELKEEIERLTNELNQCMIDHNKLLNRIDKAIEYVENEMPCLWEIDKEWEDQEDNYHHTYKEYSVDILLDILKGVDKE